MRSGIPKRLSDVENWPELAIEVHYSAGELASKWEVSLRTLQRKFRTQLNTTPQEYLNLLRQSEAEKLVRAGTRTKEIANLLQYRYASNFCRDFNEHHGMAARAWRVAKS